VVTRQLQVERGTGKVRQSKTNILTTVQRNQIELTFPSLLWFTVYDAQPHQYTEQERFHIHLST